MAAIAPRLTDGIGNRLFQLANAIELGQKWGRPVRFAKAHSKPSHGSIDIFYRLFPDIEFAVEEWKTYSVSGDNIFQYIEHRANPPSIYPLLVSGYYQSYRYFTPDTVNPSWESIFGLKGLTEIALEAGLADPSEQARTWFIHFRYGDYVNLPHHQLHGRQHYIYILKCLSEMKPGQRLHVFSDQPELCKELIDDVVGQYIDVTWSKQTIDVIALYEMSLCGGAITANSTFSWWGAYFGRQRANAKVIPYRAFYPASWGEGMPPALDIVPDWGTRVIVEYQ